MHQAEEHVCVICRSISTPQGLNRICEHDVCDACRQGDLPERVGARRWTLEVKEQYQHLNGNQLCSAQISASLPRPVTLEASFRRESLLNPVLLAWKLVRGEIRVGTPYFDDHVFISSKTPEPTKSFLRDSSVQAALQELLLQDVGDQNLVKIAGSSLAVRVVSSSSSFNQEAQVLTCILLHHLEGFMVPDVEERGPYR